MATPDDMPALLAMAQQFVQMCPWIVLDVESLRSTIAVLLASHDAYVVVAETPTGEVVGMIAGMYTRAFFNAAHGLVQELAWYVTEEARHGLYGWELLHALEQWARHKGAQSLTMATLTASSPTVAAFLVKQGFVQAETAYVKAL
jgi:L-amino acid N-acyltransferase YncA